MIEWILFKSLNIDAHKYYWTQSMRKIGFPGPVQAFKLITLDDTIIIGITFWIIQIQHMEKLVGRKC